MGENYVKIGKSGQYIAVIHQRAVLDSTAWKAVLRVTFCVKEILTSACTSVGRVFSDG